MARSCCCGGSRAPSACPSRSWCTRAPSPRSISCCSTQFLERLSPPALAEARDLLLRHFSAPSDDARRHRIALIGLRGGGKSTLGKLVAERLGLPFIELDREIEKRSGATLSEIFDMFGQETFRRAEREALDDVLRRHKGFVVATSGSIVTEPGTLELLLASCFTVWVKAAPEEHMKRVMAQGDMRPMANSARAMEDLVSILRSREPLYAKADVALSTSGQHPRAERGGTLAFDRSSR